METLKKMPEGYASVNEIVDLAEKSRDSVLYKLKKVGVQGRVVRFEGKNGGGVKIYPLREALYAVLDK